MAPRRKPVLANLLSKISVNKDTGCWEWTACKYRDGYGMICFGGKCHRAHRVSYELHCGPIPSGILVLHRCDNRVCANPKHLFLGTHAENVADKVAKGRQAGRTSHPHTKLTEADVSAIRGSTGITQTALASRYGVSQILISRIIHGQAWKMPG